MPIGPDIGPLEKPSTAQVVKTRTLARQLTVASYCRASSPQATNNRPDNRISKNTAGTQEGICILGGPTTGPPAPRRTIAIAYSELANRRSMACFRIPGGSAVSSSRA